MKLRKIRSFGVISKDFDNTAKKTALNIAKTLHNSGFNIKFLLLEYIKAEKVFLLN